MMQRYVCYESVQCRMREDSVTALKVIDSTGVEKGEKELESFEMYKHSEGWLVSANYFFRSNPSSKNDRVDTYNEHSDDWMIFFGHSKNMPAKDIHTMFYGEAHEHEETETGNEGTEQKLWYYTAAIVLSPSDQA
jgi:hypothetical protein